MAEMVQSGVLGRMCEPGVESEVGDVVVRQGGVGRMVGERWHRTEPVAMRLMWVGVGMRWKSFECWGGGSEGVDRVDAAAEVEDGHSRKNKDGGGGVYNRDRGMDVVAGQGRWGGNSLWMGEKGSKGRGRMGDAGLSMDLWIG